MQNNFWLLQLFIHCKVIKLKHLWLKNKLPILYMIHLFYDCDEKIYNLFVIGKMVKR